MNFDLLNHEPQSGRPLVCTPEINGGGDWGLSHKDATAHNRNQCSFISDRPLGTAALNAGVRIFPGKEAGVTCEPICGSRSARESEESGCYCDTFTSAGMNIITEKQNCEGEGEHVSKSPRQYSSFLMLNTIPYFWCSESERAALEMLETVGKGSAPPDSLISILIPRDKSWSVLKGPRRLRLLMGTLPHESCAVKGALLKEQFHLRLFISMYEREHGNGQVTVLFTRWSLSGNRRKKKEQEQYQENEACF